MMFDLTKIRPFKGGRPLKRADKEGKMSGKPKAQRGQWVRSEGLRWGIVLLLSLSVSILLFPRFLIAPPDYRQGEIAERDIKASHDFLVQNAELTERDREKAGREVLPVFDLDSSVINLISAVREAFDTCRELLGGPAEQERPNKTAGPANDKGIVVSPEKRDILKNRFFAILEIPPDEKAFDLLLRYGFPQEVEDRVIRLIATASERGVVANKSVLKGLMDKGGVVLHDMGSKKEILVGDLGRFYDLEGARGFFSGQARSLKDSAGLPQLVDVSIRLAQSLIKPNVTFNQRETESRKNAARESVRPIYFKVKKGEMIIREGEKIGADHLLKLSEETKRQSRLELAGRVPAMTILMGFLFSVMYLAGFGRSHTFKWKDISFSIMCLLFIFVSSAGYHFVAEEIIRGFPFFSLNALMFAMPVPFGAMLISVFQGRAAALVFSLVVSILVSLATGSRVEFFLYFFISSVIAAHGVRNCNERGILIKTGLLVGLVNVILGLCVEIIFGSFHPVGAIASSVAGLAGGVFSGVVAAGILPLIEMAFGFTTDIKLLELASLDQPLLRELMVQAPGTYHHSVIVSNMVEACAKAVQANPLMAKVSAYYHDIGKMKKPLYFIENQAAGENRHEKLAPSMSSLILISHVKDGVEMARKQKLGRELIDIVQQHHGTSLISFFFQKAQDRALKGEKAFEVKDEDFRYPGPKPQTKEAGLVMLADMAEAASRSIQDPTPARIQGAVQNVINKAFSDGQLDECELTLKDLNEIAKSFNKTLGGIFHHRIEYPEAVFKVARKGKNGNTDQVSAQDSGAKKPEDKKTPGKGLKRLGLS